MLSKDITYAFVNKKPTGLTAKVKFLYFYSFICSLFPPSNWLHVLQKGSLAADFFLAKMFESLTIVKKSKTIFNPVPHQSRLVLNLKNSENK